MASELGSLLLEAYLGRFNLLQEGNVTRLNPAVLEMASHLRGDVLSIHDHKDTDTAIAAWRLRFNGPEAAAQALSLTTGKLPPVSTARIEGNDLILLVANQEAARPLLAPGLAWKAFPPPAPPPPTPAWLQSGVGCGSRAHWG